MKNFTLVCVILICTALAQAQVGIGTITPQSALDITSSTNGILVPRVALISKNVADPIVNPQTGALVEGTLIWNTTTTGIGMNYIYPGFYFWKGGQWNELADGSGKDWSPGGNAGT
ncbi:MAG: hypothetical protein H0X63_11615, partial [Flavobacteriales bacterium]|nr:hypothetical protein [Flavobacteriales bacterium]